LVLIKLCLVVVGRGCGPAKRFQTHPVDTFGLRIHMSEPKVLDAPLVLTIQYILTGETLCAKPTLIWQMKCTPQKMRI
jgi:hypothetical protein